MSSNQSGGPWRDRGHAIGSRGPLGGEIACVAFALLVSLVGCQAKTPTRVLSQDDTAPKRSLDSTGSGSAQQAASSNAAAASTGASDERWDAIFIANKHVGHSVTRSTTRNVEGKECTETTSETQIHVNRFGSATKQVIRLKSLETQSGAPRSFSSEMQSGQGKMVAAGRRAGQEMQINNQGRSLTISLPDGCLGFLGLDHVLRVQPLRPGEQRTFQQLQPVFNSVFEVQITAFDYEETELLHGKAKLLRATSTQKFPNGQSIDTTMWLNEKGVVLKSMVQQLQTSYRTSKARALAHDPNNLDLGSAMLVRVDLIPRPHETQRIVYRATLSNRDPSQVFHAGPNQSIKRINDRTADITVQSNSPSSVVGGSSKDGNPNDVASDVDLYANSLIQSDAPEIANMAKSVAPNEADAWRIAVAMEKLVHETVTEKNFSTAMASALEVCKTKSGDCTEHSVLLVALCRARGIPARAAIGLVYIRQPSSFGYPHVDGSLDP